MKCLGVWWSSNGSSHKSIEERINKAHGAFFAHGQLGSFHGQLNPLSSRSLMCNACLDVQIQILAPKHHPAVSTRESFQAELGKRVLQLPRTTANSIPLITLNWPSWDAAASVQSCASCFKPAPEVQSCTDTLREEVFKSLSYSDVEALDLVKQCRLLELPYSQTSLVKYYPTQLRV